MNNQKTHLYNEHLKLNAKIVPFAGWDMPVQYTSVKDEVIAVRNHVGMFDVSHMGEFFVTGDGALDFIDYAVTNDIKNAPLGKAIYSPLCREDGSVIDDLIIYKIADDRMLICVNASNVEKDFSWLKALSEKFKCTIENKSDVYSLIALQGPKSEEILARILPQVKNLSYYSVLETTLQNQSLIIARTGYTGEDGYEIFADHQTIQNLWLTFLDLGVTPCGLAARDVLRLEVCYPLYGHELSDQLTPADGGINWTVKFTKPNFIGKAALQNSKPKFRLAKLIVEKGIPREGYSVENENGEVIGKVTSGTMSVTINQGVALALIQTDKFPSSEKIFVDIRGKKYPSQIIKKPFVTGGHK